jgi:hypothetical protein
MLSIDMSNVITQAFTIVNQLWPIFVIPLGLILGFSLLRKIFDLVKGAFAGG